MKEFLYGAGAVALIWWLWGRKSCCQSDNVPAADAGTSLPSQTLSSARTTDVGSPQALPGLLPADITRAPVPTNPHPATELEISIASTRVAQTAIPPVAPGPTNFFASGGSLPKGTVGEPVGIRLPKRVQTWHIG